MTHTKKVLLAIIVAFMTFSIGRQVFNMGGRKTMQRYMAEKYDCVERLGDDPVELTADMCTFYMMDRDRCLVFPHWGEAYIAFRMQRCLFEKGIE